MKVVLLGTGTPRQDPARFGPATAVVVDQAAYLFDCGPGVGRRIAAARANGIEALAPMNLKTLFVTHLHCDHTIGYPDVILSPWVVGRTAPLTAYGPPGFADMTRHLLAAYREDIDVRTRGLEHGNSTGWHVRVHEIGPGLVHHDERVTVEAFPVKHGAWKDAFGYRVRTSDRTIVISGDTRPVPEMEVAAQGADLLIHEVYAADEATVEDRPGGAEWAEYMRESHTSAEEVGAIAARSKVKQLVLVHVLRRYATDNELIAQVRSGGYSGPVCVGQDLQVFDL